MCIVHFPQCMWRRVCRHLLQLLVHEVRQLAQHVGGDGGDAQRRGEPHEAADHDGARALRERVAAEALQQRLQHVVDQHQAGEAPWRAENAGRGGKGGAACLLSQTALLRNCRGKP